MNIQVMQERVSSKDTVGMQIHACSDLMSVALGMTERLAQLQIMACQSNMEVMTDAVRRTLTSSTYPEMLNVVAEVTRPIPSKAWGYSRHLVSISSTSQSKFSDIVNEHFANMNSSMMAMLTNLGETSPVVGAALVSPALVSATKDMVDDAQEQLEKISAISHEISGSVDDTFSRIVSQFSDVAVKEKKRKNS